MNRILAAVLAIVALIAAIGGSPAVATPAPSTITVQNGAGGYAVVRVNHVSLQQFAAMVRATYPLVRLVVKNADSVIVQGSASDVASVRHLADAIAKMPPPAPKKTLAPSECNGPEVRCFTVDPAIGPQVAAALAAFIQGLPPLPSPSTSPAQSTVNVVVKTGSGTQRIQASSTPPPAVVVSPSQSTIIVRADRHTLDLISSTVMPALAVPPAEKSPSQSFRPYEVKYPVPNPIASGGTSLLATSSIADLAAAVQNVINQTGPVDVRVTPDPSYPRILVAGSPSGVKHAFELLNALDKRPAQVNIEAQFYEIDTNAASNIGFQLPTGAIQTTIGEYSPPAGVAANGSPIAATPPPLLSPQKLTHTNVSIAAQLNLLYSRGEARLLATPHVATINGRRTMLTVLNNIPFPVTNPGNSAAVPTVQNYQTGTTLEIVPMVNNDGSISAYLHPTYSTLTGFTALQAPLISTREAFTTFRLLSGQAVYISGLVESIESDTTQKIPGLGNLPLVGGLFRNRVRTHTTTQLFIVLTASVVDPGDLQIAPLEIDPNRPPTPKPPPLEVPLGTPPPVAVPSVSPPTPSPTPRH